MKKRYEVYIYDDCSVEVCYDGVTLKDIHFENDLRELLNKKDQKIKELENKLKTSYREGLLQKQFDKDMEIEKLKKENQRLKQSQNIIAIDELLGLRDIIEDGIDELEYINDRINDLKGGI